MGLMLQITQDPATVTAPKLIAMGNPKTDPRVAELMKAYGLELTDAMAKEGYVLGIGSKGIVIGAESARGLLYGTATLRQMLVCRGRSAPLPAVRVRDWPKMAMRGVHDEFSYGQVSTMENFKDMIRFLADFKMNTLIFYFEDTFRFARYPTIGEGRGALTREQVDELEAFARPLGVEIIPVFEMLGNQGALLMLDEVRTFAEFPGSHSFAVNDEAFGFLSNCFGEMAAAFDSKYFHAGLDESWDLGFGKSEELVNRVGRGPAHAAHYRRINDLFKSRGKTMIMYGDIILKYPEILDLIPKDIVLMDWQYEPADHYPTVDVLGLEGVSHPGAARHEQLGPDLSRHVQGDDQHSQHHARLLSPAPSAGLDHFDLGRQRLQKPARAALLRLRLWSRGNLVARLDRRIEFFRPILHTAERAGHRAVFRGDLRSAGEVAVVVSDARLFSAPFLASQGRAAAHDPGAVIASMRTRGRRRSFATCFSRWSSGERGTSTTCATARMHEHYVESQRLVADLNAFATQGLSNDAIDSAQARFLEAHPRGPRRGGQPARHV